MIFRNIFYLYVGDMKKLRLPVKKQPLQKSISNYFITQTKHEDVNDKLSVEIKKTEPEGKQTVQYKIEEFDSPSPAKDKTAKRKRMDTPTKRSPLKTKQKLISPLKKELVDSFFNEDFNLDDKTNRDLRKLNLGKLERFEVLNTEILQSGDIKLDVKGLSYADNCGTCLIKSPWSNCPLKSGDIVSLRGCLSEEGWVIDWKGLLVCNSNHLISGTTIVGSLYCTRKTVLSHLFEEIGERDSRLMVIGCIVHELLQEVLKKKYQKYEDIEKVFKEIVQTKDFTIKLFLEKMEYEETLNSISSFLPRIYEFISRYVTFGKTNASYKQTDENWQGEIIKVKDIEETIWSPTLGIKGKVDATVQVKIGKKTKVMPLELKTGKVSFSLEHRGQVILYCMLLQELGEFVESGLLLYVKDEGGMKEIQAAEREIRDLTLLRNGLSHWLYQSEKVDELHIFHPPILPPPINRKSCQSCGHLIACSSALRLSGSEKLSENNVLRKLIPEVTNHLTEDHLKYVFRLIGLQSLENSSTKSSISRIWSVPPDKREENGWCLTNMEVDSSSIAKGGKFEIIFKKSDSSLVKEIFELGQTIVVSKKDQIALAIGFVQLVSPLTITILLDKFIKPSEKQFQLDSYESNSLNNLIRTNIGLLLDNSVKAQILRESIIDLKVPTFLPKLSSKVKKLGQEIFERLNKEQIRAVLQAMSAENYILIKGMPGTGKTTTMRALIELLVKFGNRVLITSYTHSAIDNILIGMVGKVSILRLGSNKRIHPKLKHASEEMLLDKLNSPTTEKLEKIYKSKQVVGVTCHGSGHLWLQRQEFDVCIVDEATQVTVPIILKPLFLAKKFVLIGDPKQLPPLILNEKAKEMGLGESLFKRLDRPAVTSVLAQQYRMNQTITDLANGFSYEGQLKCGNDLVANATLQYNGRINSDWPLWKTKVLSTDLEDSVVVVDVENKSLNNESNVNESESKVVLDIVKELEKLGIKGNSIGIIATYKEQVNLLKNILSSVKEIEVNTVDQYQGRDKEIIIYSTTRSKKSTGKDITSDINRLTVAITRAKKKLVIICNLDIIKSYDNFNKLFEFVHASNFVRFS